jgi:hypothetical protein
MSDLPARPRNAPCHARLDGQVVQAMFEQPCYWPETAARAACDATTVIIAGNITGGHSLVGWLWKSTGISTRVQGKGRRRRACPFGRRTAQALDRYRRARASHRDKDRPEFWLGLAGPMTPNGVADVVRRRGGAAGIADVHPHRFCHTYAHQWLAAGGNEGDPLMRRVLGTGGSGEFALYPDAARARVSLLRSAG